MTSKTESSTGDGTTKTWLGALMFGLLYPAVLGTFFYSLLPEAFAVVRERGELDGLRLAKLVISLLLVLHFIFDFYFTQQVALEASRYSGKEFFFDLLIVISLFVAYETTHLDDKGFEPEVTWVAGSLCVSYVLFQIWERWMKPVIGINRLLNIYEITAAIIFFLIAAFLPRVDVLALAIFISAACMFFVARPIVLRVRNELRTRYRKGDSREQGETVTTSATPADNSKSWPEKMPRESMNSRSAKLIAGSLLLPSAFLLILLIFQAWDFEPPRERLSVIAELVQALAILVAGGWAVYTWTSQAQDAERRRRLERVESLHRDFIDQASNRKRGEIAELWRRWLRVPERFPQKFFPQCGSSVDDVSSAVKATLGIEVSIPTAEEVAQNPGLVEETELLCNRFEHLGKLVEVGVVTPGDVRLFFYTLIGDTFLLVLPYILFRRQAKPRYAARFQQLLCFVPSISDDPARI